VQRTVAIRRTGEGTGEIVQSAGEAGWGEENGVRRLVLANERVRDVV
jgi:hypothetical protein